MSAGSVRFRCSRRGHVLLAQFAKCLHQETAQPPRRLHVPRLNPALRRQALDEEGITELTRLQAQLRCRLERLADDFGEQAD